jgi:hypothetical protein
MTLYQVQRQRTAGAYKTLRSFRTQKQAVGYLTSIAKLTPSFPYNGSDSWKDSNDIHNVNRYKIVKVIVD